MTNCYSHSLETAWPEKQRNAIVPFFMPFLGCRNKCIFCAQELQTGLTASNNYDYLARRLEQLLLELRERLKIGRPLPELAFYGGTFTALPADYWLLCLGMAKFLLEEGLISSWRCSTRPDALTYTRLHAMKKHGCRMVELGIQSFADDALKQSGRPYSGAKGRLAISQIQEAGLAAGVQLLPGMPGSTPGLFLQDVACAVSAGAACLRFYPCLVIAGSELSRLWQEGLYSPWSLEQTLETLAEGWLHAWQAGVPVIRMGLAPEPGLDNAVLAGPRHNCLGSRIMGRALLNFVNASVPETARIRLWLPPALRGCIWGWRGELRKKWPKNSEIIYWPEPKIRLEWG